MDLLPLTAAAVAAAVVVACYKGNGLVKFGHRDKSFLHTFSADLVVAVAVVEGLRRRSVVVAAEEVIVGLEKGRLLQLHYCYQDSR